MIFKQGQPVHGLRRFVQENPSVLAKRILADDFIIETGQGWLQGKRGNWLVLIANDLWLIVDDAQFRRIYAPKRLAQGAV